MITVTAYAPMSLNVEEKKFLRAIKNRYLIPPRDKASDNWSPLDRNALRTGRRDCKSTRVVVRSIAFCSA